MSSKCACEKPGYIIKGLYDTGGKYMPFHTPLPVVQLGDTLRHADDGERLAIKENGEWYWASLYRLEIKCKIKLEAKP